MSSTIHNTTLKHMVCHERANVPFSGKSWECNLRGVNSLWYGKWAANIDDAIIQLAKETIL